MNFSHTKNQYLTFFKNKKNFIFFKKIKKLESDPIPEFINIVENNNLPNCYDMLKECSLQIGSQQIQNLGTIGGNLCNASPAADGVPCLLSLDASIELLSLNGKRVLKLEDFIKFLQST